MNPSWSLRILLPGAVALFLFTAVAISVVGGVVERRSALQQELQADSQREISLLAELAERMLTSNPELLSYSVARLATVPNVAAAAVIDARGTILFSTNQIWKHQAITQLPGFVAAQYDQARQGRAAVFRSSDHGRRLAAMMSYATPASASQIRSLDRGIVYIQYDQSAAFDAAQVAALTERLPEAGLLLFVAGLLGVVVQRLVVRPIEYTQQAAQAIANGDFGHRLQVGGPSELRGLARAFNEMTRKLAESISRLTGQAQTLQTLLHERQQMEHERDRLISVLEATTDFVGIADPQGRVLYINHAGRRLAGLGDRDVSMLDISQMHPEWAYRVMRDQGIPAAIQNGSWSGETALLDATGREIPISQIILSHLDDQGVVQYISTVIRDITAQKRAEQEIHSLNAELEQRVAKRTRELENANKELESFSYSVSHDLRAPLRAVDGFSQLLIEDYGEQLDETGRNHLRRVRAGAQFMGQLIDDLLDLSRVSRAPLQPCDIDLTSMAQEVVTLLREQDPGREVQVAIADHLHGHGDPGLLRILLENLLGNAWKYTGKTAHPQIRFEAQRSGEETVYCVGDNGAGFDMQFAGKLFGAFQRLHRKDQFEGTGIGLATVARIVQRHGGRVWAEAVIDQGARFYFTLGGGARHGVHRIDSTGPA